ncbi:hypothetical protein GUITHDRAFT_101162 [Guillardia theta CCMP2712]|uniref:Uncharacterized protein n=1 Tax=Guillardia theta (strain CCMP2712) TaxID=905079 RepID=L1JZ21_GUITC|nr:hypothetical protein GUITHDRAFT_101162 [Guillardia theta CCMP2712]EKX53460.1 hypothetical protein GUITHDRAFT_101162 [Guillardia theta CCMP2712]|eukprot:XP_005840440.1 hypothetical protein GUITHDRAFT_101162 [Guillardia theta CCMP2712]
MSIHEEWFLKKVESFSRLEEDYLFRLQQLEQSVEEKHRSRWQYLRAESEVEDLQQALSDAKLAIFDEREKVLKLTAENDMLKLQEINDRQRIQQLLSLTQPVAEEITLFKESLPAHLVHGSKFYQQYDNDSYSLNSSGKLMMQNSMSSLTPSSQAAQFRTVFLPSQNSEVLLMELQALRLQTEEQKRCWREKEQVLLEDRRIKMAETAMARERHAAQVEDLQNAILKLEKEVAHVTKDYFIVRHSCGKDVHEAKMREAATEKKFQELANHFENFSSKTISDIEKTANCVHQKNQSVLDAYKAQALEADQEVLRLKSKPSSSLSFSFSVNEDWAGPSVKSRQLLDQKLGGVNGSFGKSSSPGRGNVIRTPLGQREDKEKMQVEAMKIHLERIVKTQSCNQCGVICIIVACYELSQGDAHRTREQSVCIIIITAIISIVIIIVIIIISIIAIIIIIIIIIAIIIISIIVIIISIIAIISIIIIVVVIIIIM